MESGLIAKFIDYHVLNAYLCGNCKQTLHSLFSKCSILKNKCVKTIKSVFGEITNNVAVAPLSLARQKLRTPRSTPGCTPIRRQQLFCSRSRKKRPLLASPACTASNIRQSAAHFSPISPADRVSKRRKALFGKGLKCNVVYNSTYGDFNILLSLAIYFISRLQ